MVNARLIPWLEQHAGERFFAFVHYWDPHQPYTQPGPFRRRFNHQVGSLADLEVKTAPAGYRYVPGWGKEDEMFEGYGVVIEHRSPGSTPSREASIDLYDGAVAYVDQAIGELVTTIQNAGLLDSTLVVVTSDHGELLGQHGIYTHANLYEANTHMPLIMRYPERLPQSTRVPGLCGHIDLMPTLCDLAGIEAPPAGDGTSLLGMIRDEPPRAEIISEDGGGVRAIRRGPHKLIRYCEDDGVELYDVERDPMEVVDLAARESEVVRQLREHLARWERASLEPGQDDPIQYVIEHQPCTYRETLDGLRMKRYRGTGYVYGKADA